MPMALTKAIASGNQIIADLFRDNSNNLLNHVNDNIRCADFITSGVMLLKITPHNDECSEFSFGIRRKKKPGVISIY